MLQIIMLLHFEEDPSKVFTGAPGRPAKKYNLVPAAESPRPSEYPPHNSSSEEEFFGWDDEQLGMIASTNHAISGPDKEELEDSIY